MARDETTASPPVRVVVDDRERGCAAVLALAAMPEVACEFRRLDLGDYRVDGCLLVERKTLTDLVASITDGRLFRQAYALATHEARPLLILEGTAAEIADCGMRREAIQGALVTVTVVWGVPVLRALDGAESARLMLYAARQLRRAATGMVFRPGRRPRGRKRAQLRVLLGLPGIGKTRAERLLDAFGTVEAVMTAGAKALTDVAGIGADTAAGIRWAVGAAADEKGGHGGAAKKGGHGGAAKEGGHGGAAPTYDPAIHHRRSIRLDGYDYAREGAYYVTVCAEERQRLFGHVIEGHMVLNDAGRMVQAVWDELPAHYPGVGIDMFVVMPDHIHGIVYLGAGRCARSAGFRPDDTPATAGMSLPDVVNRFKTMTTKRYADGVKQSGWPRFPGTLWQRNYYEHIVRNDADLNRIREYIRNNPVAVGAVPPCPPEHLS